MCQKEGRETTRESIKQPYREDRNCMNVPSNVKWRIFYMHFCLCLFTSAYFCFFLSCLISESTKSWSHVCRQRRAEVSGDCNVGNDPNLTHEEFLYVGNTLCTFSWFLFLKMWHKRGNILHHKEFIFHIWFVCQWWELIVEDLNTRWAVLTFSSRVWLISRSVFWWITLSLVQNIILICANCWSEWWRTSLEI